MSKPSYVPSPAEILESCREIQDGWSVEQERSRRTGSVALDPYEIREVATPRGAGFLAIVDP